MRYSFWLIAIFLTVNHVFHHSQSIIVDDFTKKGRKNRLGFRRSRIRCNNFTPNGIHIPIGGSVTEYFAFHKLGVDLTGKAFKITYSAKEIQRCKLAIRHEGQCGRMSRYQIITLLAPGCFRTIIIPLTEFRSPNVSKISEVTVQGQILLHCIENIDDVNFSHSNCPDDVSDPVPESPVRLIDDFTQPSDSSINSMQGLRQNSDGVEMGSGFVMISEGDDYLLEYFATKTTPLKMSYLAFRFIYSTTTTRQFILGLVYKPVDDNENIVMCTYEFPGGQQMEVIVPFSAFTESNPQISVMDGYGLTINGPLVLHRIEVVVNEQESRMIKTLDNEVRLDRDVGNFIKKYTYLKNALQLITIQRSFRIDVDYANVFTNAYQLMTVQSFRMELDVYFIYEPRKSQLATKDRFFSYIEAAIAAPETRLFEYSLIRKRELRIISNSNVHPDILDQYRFVGRLLGMGILNGKMRMIKFLSLMFTIILDQLPNYSELSQFGHLITTEIQEDFNFLPHVSTKIRTMSVEYTEDETGEHVVVDLIPNGRYVVVDRENYHIYASAYYKWFVNRYIGAQANAIREGLFDVIPKTLLEGFNGDELSHILSGGRLKHPYLPSLAF